jgi:uncharacterized protein YjbJ (UPF0337 family)
MADMVKDQTTDATTEGRGNTLRNLSDQAASIGQTAKENLSQVGDNAAGALKDARETFSGRAREFSEDVKDRVEDKIDEQRDAGADYAARVADAMRRAAKEFETDVPFAATYMSAAADNVHDYAEKFRSGELKDFVEAAKSFAGRQPTAFLGLTFLAGFGLVRLLKAGSADAAPGRQS